MSGYEYPIPVEESMASIIKWPDNPIRNILIVGHGALAKRQRPTYEHWLSQGISVHCIDCDPAKFKDCLDGIHHYVFPEDEKKLLAEGPFDLLCVNNFPELHLATALQYSTHAHRIIIQKPQDLNFPLIRTINHAPGYEPFRNKSVIHDHYRNKSAFVALLNALPSLLQTFGQFRRLIFFLTEAKSVNDEIERLDSLKCGMIQDIAIHMIDLMLESIFAGSQWRGGDDDERLHKRVGGMIKLIGGVKESEQNSGLGNQVETLAVIDLQVTEQIIFPANHRSARARTNQFDVLIVVGKGLDVEQGVSEDLKAVYVEFERDKSYSLVDLAALSVQNIPLIEINRQHGGLNRPLMLISPNPPSHASYGAGGLEFKQWQSFSGGEHVAALAEAARNWEATKRMNAYPPHRPLGDLIRTLATREIKIRPTWGDLPSLTNFQIKQPHHTPYYD